MKRTLDKITTVTDRICYGVSFFSMAVCIILAVVLFADVILRKATNGTVTVKGAYEIAQMLLSTFVFSSWAYTQSVLGHIEVVLLIQRLPQKLRFVFYAFTALLSVVTVAIGAYAVYFQIFNVKASGESTANLLIPYWPFYIFEFVAFVLLAVVLLRDAVKAVCAIFNNEIAEEIQGDWV